mgnify:CR=1 FL=1
MLTLKRERGEMFRVTFRSTAKQRNEPRRFRVVSSRASFFSRLRAKADGTTFFFPFLPFSFFYRQMFPRGNTLKTSSVKKQRAS